MSATRAIFFGVALGFAAGATVAIAQDTAPATQIDGTPGAAIPASPDMVQQGEENTSLDTNMTTAAPTGIDLIDIAPEALIDARVYDSNGDWIGEISAVLPKTETSDRSVVIDVGGFLGVGEKPVQIAYDDISVSTDENGDVEQVVVAMTKPQLEALPEVQK